MNKHEVHPDMPTQAQAKAALAMPLGEILLARNVIRDRLSLFEDALAALDRAFIDGRYAEIKSASEKLRTESQSAPVLIAEKMRQIDLSAAGIVNGCVHQLNRRPRP